MSELRPSRRSPLKGVTAAGAAAALASVPGVALEPDPAFAAIAVHASARRRLNDMDSTDAGWDAALDEEGALWGAFCSCTPTTLEGLAAYARHAADYPDLWVLTGNDGPADIIKNMAKALRALRQRGATNV